MDDDHVWRYNNLTEAADHNGLSFGYPSFSVSILSGNLELEKNDYWYASLTGYL